MKYYKDRVKILACERLKNSKNGNPRYEIIVINNNNEIYTGKTVADGRIGYKIGSNFEKSTVEIWYHVTPKTRKIIFDDFR